MKAVGTGIYNYYKANTSHAFYTGTGGRLYHEKAPPGATFPYCVYLFLTGDHDLDFSCEREEVPVQFNVFTQSFDPADAATLLASLWSLFDDCTLTVSEYRHLEFIRDTWLPNNDKTQEPPIYGWSVLYTCLIEKARS